MGHARRRAATRSLHIDNTATHLGLEPATAIAAKYEQSAANFARVVARHPAIVVALSQLSRRAAAEARARLRPRSAPVQGPGARAEAPALGPGLSLRLYRAALYAEAV